MPKSKSRAKLTKLDPLVQQITSLESPAVIEVPTDGFNAAALAIALTNALHKADVYAVIIDRAPVINKDTLLHAIYQSCEFPKTFGFNWDALVDCLSDFAWAEAKGYALILKQPALLKARAPEDFATLLDVMQAVSERWAREGVPFKLVLPHES
jgi:RNAse (barnase) inhibitor barstar